LRRTKTLREGKRSSSKKKKHVQGGEERGLGQGKKRGGENFFEKRSRDSTGYD